jgi:hypothetical protein
MFLLVSPAFASWLPHGAVHALHENNIKHFLEKSHQHSPHQYSHDHDNGHHHNHDDNVDADSDNHHPVHIDIISFYDDYINADLQRLNLNNLHVTAFDFYQVDFFYSTLDIALYSDADSLHAKSHPLLDWGAFSSSTAPLYLSTQRLRM